MHELGIVFSMIDEVEEAAKQNHAKKVLSITLEVGEVSTIIPSYFEDCFEWAKKKTDDLQECKLNIVVVEAVSYCRTCKKTYPTTKTGRSCPYCGGKSSGNGTRKRTYNHLPMGGTPSLIIWKRRRYLCNDCGKSFVEDNPFGPEAFQQTYAVLRNVADDLCNIHYSFEDIAKRNRISTTLVELYCDSFVQVPRLSLPENLGIDEI